MKTLRAGLVVATSAVLAWVAGCSESKTGPCSVCSAPPRGGVLVSNPISTAAGATVASRAIRTSLGADVVYVSMTAGTAPAGTSATIRRVGDTLLLRVPVIDGAVDPVQVPAQIGDLIDVVVRDAQGVTVYRQSVTVMANRPPVVVRTDPPRKKTDVPLNASIVIAFSEPVAGTSLNAAAIQLTTGGVAVSGTVRFVDSTFGASGTSVEFAPDAPLAANTQYLLVVSEQVRDLAGRPLAAADTTTFTTGSTSSYYISPPLLLSPGDTVAGLSATASLQVTVTVRDPAGNRVTDRPVTWLSSDPAVATVSPTGLVTATGLGRAGIEATVACPCDSVGQTRAGYLSASLWVLSAPGPAASVTLDPATVSVPAVDTVFLTATAHDANGFPTILRFTNSSPSVATVTAVSGGLGLETLMVIGVSQGKDTVIATSGMWSDTSIVTVGPPVPVASVTVIGANDTLVVEGRVALTATVRDSANRVLLRPVTWTTDNMAVATVDTTGVVTAVGSGTTAIHATSGGVSGSATIVAHTVSFVTVSGGSPMTVGLTADSSAYSWSSGGGLDSVPVPVPGGLKFAMVTAGLSHACGLTATGAAYCWGDNAYGDLGNGNPGGSSLTPVAVMGGGRYTSLSAGGWHTCGVSGTAACWGWNLSGQLGNGTTQDWSVPYQVSAPPGVTLQSISAGKYHTCALATSGAAYCWGNGGLGDGVSASSLQPVLVSGGLVFNSVSAGDQQSCGVTTTGAGYCWGSGALGDGAIATNSTPVAVAGGLTFTVVSANSFNSCGLTAGGSVYCWPTYSSNLPGEVSGGLIFASWSQDCGVTTGGVAYCWVGNALAKVPGQP